MAKLVCVFCLALILLPLVSPAPAVARVSSRWAKCHSANVDERILGCSQIIARGRRESRRKQVTAYINRGGAYWERGDFHSAVVDLDRALKLNRKSLAALNERASIYLAKGDVDRALADYDRALATHPRSAKAYNGRGEAYLAKKDLEQAVANFDRALRLDKNMASAYAGRARAYHEKGDLDKALADFNEAINLSPKSASLRLERGETYNAKGDFVLALADYDAAIDIEPKFAEAFLARAEVYLKQHDLEHAKRDLEAALGLNPQLATAKQSLGEVNRLIAKRVSAKRVSPPVAAAPKRPSPLASEIIFHLGPAAITRPVVTTWAIMAFLAIISWLLTRRLKLIPGPRQAVLELAVTGIIGQIQDVIRRDPRPFLPLLGTLFIFLVTANLSGLLPQVEAPTSKLETPAALALIVFLSVHFFGVQTRGLFGYLKSFAEPKLIMLPLNIISEVTRTFSLMVRLFGNVMSGEFVIALVVALAGLFVPIPLMLLEVLVGVVQAYIFTVLATVFIGAAIGSVERA